MNGEKNAIMVNYSDKELAAGVARELKSFITDHVNQILNEKAEDEQTARRRTANIKVIDLTSPSSQKEG